MNGSHMSEQSLSRNQCVDFDNINASIRNNGFSRHSLQLMDDYTNDIINGKTNITRFNQAEHAGLCRAGEMLIGAYIVCNYARTSLEASADAATSQASPTNWEIDQLLSAKGFQDNNNGLGVNYIGKRLHLEDMHPANVFIDFLSDAPICIDCIIKFVR